VCLAGGREKGRVNRERGLSAPGLGQTRCGRRGNAVAGVFHVEHEREDFYPKNPEFTLPSVGEVRRGRTYPLLCPELISPEGRAKRRSWGWLGWRWRGTVRGKDGAGASFGWGLCVSGRRKRKRAGEASLGCVRFAFRGKSGLGVGMV